MIAAGFAFATRGQKMYLRVLRTLRAELAHSLESRAEGELSKPSWNPNTGNLTLRGEVVRHVRGVSVAKRLHSILDAFESAGWPERIEAPANYDQQELHDAIRGLNKDLKAIHFRADGTGKGVVWEVRS
jgi:hypothetical protein